MTGNEAKQLVAVLKAAFPRQPIEPETVKVYATFLEDLDVESASEAMKLLAQTSRFFPTIAEVREAVAEIACALPSEQAAIAQVEANVAHRPEWVECPTCEGSCYADKDAEVVCSTCRGVGRSDARPRPSLHPVVREALDSLGGLVAYRDAEIRGVIRAQLRDAYRDLRRDAIRGIQTGERPALAPIEKLAALPVAAELRSMT